LANPSAMMKLMMITNDDDDDHDGDAYTEAQEVDGRQLTPKLWLH